MVEERDESRKIVKCYPLAVKMGKNVFDCKPEFSATKNSKIYEKAYKLTTSLHSDVIFVRSILQLMLGLSERVGVLFVFIKRL